MLRCLEGAPERVIDTDDSMTENRPEVRKMCPKQYPCYYAGYRRNIDGPRALETNCIEVAVESIPKQC